MKARQVFKMYPDNTPNQVRRPRFCDRCGAEYRIEGITGIASKCPECGGTHYIQPNPAVSVLVTKGDMFLLGKRSGSSYEPGKWCLPCGYIELDEDFLTACKREVKEETGMTVRVKSIISVVTNYFVDKQSLVIVVAAEPVADAPSGSADGEMTEVRWFKFGEPLPEMAFQADTHIIERYFTDRLQGAPVDPDFR